MLLPLLTTLVLAADAKPKLAISDIAMPEGLEPAGKVLSTRMAVLLEQRGIYEVVSAREIESMLSNQRQKQLMGCADDATGCMVELAEALGADLLLSGTVARLGNSYTMTLQTVKQPGGKSIGRAVRVASDIEDFLDDLPWAVAEATGLVQPPRVEKSRVLPFTLIGVGLAGLIGGGVVGLQALLQEGTVKQQLTDGQQNAEVLGTLASYKEQATAVRTQKTISLVSLCVGAAFVVAGITIFAVTSRTAVKFAALSVSPDGSLAFAF